jgi:RNA polymerase sigma-70 factor, ECF subfamily
MYWPSARHDRVPEAESRLKSLMLLSLGGDGTAYRELLIELSERLRVYYRRRLGEGCSDAEDLVQETLMAIHSRRASFDRKQLFTPWAYAMARYKLVDYLRRTRVRIAVSVDDCEDLFAADETEPAAAARDVDRLLSRLPRAMSNAIRLTRIEGHSINETAERTGKSPAATKVSIHRGLLRLSKFRVEELDADD